LRCTVERCGGKKAPQPRHTPVRGAFRSLPNIVVERRLIRLIVYYQRWLAREIEPFEKPVQVIEVRAILHNGDQDCLLPETWDIVVIALKRHRDRVSNMLRVAGIS
jgi:hypothetical protein